VIVRVEEEFGAVGGGGAIEIMLRRSSLKLTLQFLLEFSVDAVDIANLLGVDFFSFYGFVAFVDDALEDTSAGDTKAVAGFLAQKQVK